MWLNLLVMVATFCATSGMFWLWHRKEHNECTLYLVSRGRELPVRLKVVGPLLEIRPVGYGEYAAEDGYGAPVMLDWYDEKLQLHVNYDINSDSMETSCLEGAAEKLRQAVPD